MIEVTLSRLDGFIPAERRIIVTHRDQLDATKSLVGNRCGTFIAEPEAKNTGAALAAAALEIQSLATAKNPTMISLHADHTIQDLNEFLRVLDDGSTIAEQGRLVLVAIKPTRPDTGFGYIERGAALHGTNSAWDVASFKEKPDFFTAEQYVKSGRYSWNSGIFIWMVPTLLSELREFMPETIGILESAAKAWGGRLSQMPTPQLAPFYGKLSKTAIDNGLLERSRNVAFVEGDFGWQDVGTWAALDQCFPTDDHGNLLFGDVYTEDAQNCVVDSDGPFIAALGIKDLVVVSAKGAILVCPKDRAQDVKNIVEYLKESGRKGLV
jgi:mannose-1-phosphate guanylyltransferase